MLHADYAVTILAYMLCLYSNQVCSCVYAYYNSTVHQTWSLEQEPEIPGVFHIGKANPKLYITAQVNARDNDKIFFKEKIQRTGRTVQRQLWRMIPIEGTQYSKIQNYASTGKYINIPNSLSEVALQTYQKSGDDNDYFYVNLVNHDN